MESTAKKAKEKTKKVGIPAIKKAAKARVNRLLKKAKEAIENKDIDEAKHFLSQARSAAHRIKYDIDNKVIRMQEKIKKIKNNGKKKRRTLRKGHPTNRMGNPRMGKGGVRSRNSSERVRD